MPEDYPGLPSRRGMERCRQEVCGYHPTVSHSGDVTAMLPRLRREALRLFGTGHSAGRTQKNHRLRYQHYKIDDALTGGESVMVIYCTSATDYLLVATRKIRWL